jgi:hypothetical protein
MPRLYSILMVVQSYQIIASIGFTVIHDGGGGGIAGPLYPIAYQTPSTLTSVTKHGGGGIGMGRMAPGGTTNGPTVQVEGGGPGHTPCMIIVTGTGLLF